MNAFRQHQLTLAISSALAITSTPALAIDYNFLGQPAGYWETAGRWQGGVLPGSTDDLAILLPQSYTYISGYNQQNQPIYAVRIVTSATIEHRTAAGTSTINSISGANEADILISGGTLNLLSDSVVNSRFTMSGGALNSKGNITFNGLTQFINLGNLSGVGTTVLNGASSVTGDSSSLYVKDGRVLENRNSLLIDGSNGFSIINLRSQGENSAGKLVNAVGANMELRGSSNNGVMQTYGGQIDNKGTLTVTGGNASIGGNVTNGGQTTLNNLGTISIQQGLQLSLAGSGSHSGSFNGAGSLIIDYGTHQINNANSLNTAKLQVGGSTLTGGDFNLNNDVLFSGSSTLSGTGHTDILGHTTLSTGTSTTTNNSPVTLSLSNNRALDNNNTFLIASYSPYSYATLNMDSTSSFKNEANSTLELHSEAQSQSSFSYGGASISGGSINNEGLIKVTGGGTSYIGGSSAQFTHNGIIDIDTAANLSISANSSHTGSFSGNGTLTLSGGTQQLEAASDITTAKLSVSGGTVNLGRDWTFGSTYSQYGSTVNGTGMTFTNTTQFGAISQSSYGTGGGSLLMGTLSGDAIAHLKGNTTIIGLALANNRTLQNENWAILNGTFNLGTGTTAGQFINAQGASLDFKSGSLTGGSSINRGDITVSGQTTIGSSLTDSNVVPTLFANDGNINILDSKQLTLYSNGSHTGSFSGEGSLLFASGTQHFTAPSSFSTANVTLGNATLDLQRDWVIDSKYAQNGGVLSGKNITFNNAAIFSGGRMTGNATTYLNGNATINNLTLTNNRILQNNHDLSITGERLYLGNGPTAGQLINSTEGTTTLQTGNDPYHLVGISGGKVTNDGVIKLIGSGIGYIGDQYYTTVFNNNGTVDLQQGELFLNGTTTNHGTLHLADNTLLAANGRLINATDGVISGNGELRLNPAITFINAGHLAPGNSPGSLSIDGDMLLSATSQLDIELASMTSFDHLNVSGNLTLGGTLNLIAYDGFTAKAGDSFNFLAFQHVFGQFDAIHLIGFNGLTASLNLNAGHLNFTFANTTPVPVPASIWLFASALAGFGVSKRKTVSS